MDKIKNLITWLDYMFCCNDLFFTVLLILGLCMGLCVGWTLAAYLLN